MNEITLVNLLNKICEKNEDLLWKLNCKYSDGREHTFMEVEFHYQQTNQKAGFVLFNMENAKVIRGKHRGMIPFSNKMMLMDVLLDILHYESQQLAPSLN
jgi:hypothetical protein